MQGDSSEKRTFNMRTKSLLTNSFSGSVLGVNGQNKITQHLTLPQLTLKDKYSFVSKSQCQLCFSPFKIGRMQHFCKICGLAVCSSCSTSTINKQRACDLCSYHFSNPQRQLDKQKIILELKKITKEMIYQKDQIEAKLNSLQMEIPSDDMIKKQQEQHEKKMLDLNKKLQKIKAQRIFAEQRLRELKTT